MPVVLRLIPCLLVLVLAACQKTQPTQAKGPMGPPVVPVSIAKAAQEPVPTELRVVGTVEASAIVQMRSQVAGPLMRVSFTEGQNVNAGDLLFEIDRRPFEDALRQAEAAVSRAAICGAIGVIIPASWAIDAEVAPNATD